MKRTRAYRRHQFRRALRRAKRMLKSWGYKLEDSERHVHLFAKTRRPCSCYICRNEKYDRQNGHIDEEIERGLSEMGSL